MEHWHSNLSDEQQSALHTVLSRAQAVDPHSPSRIALGENESAVECLQRIPPITLSDISRAIFSLYPESDVRYHTSAFYPNTPEEVFLVPHHVDRGWKTIDAIFSVQKPSVSIFLMPPLWQLGPVFYRLCRKHKIPASLILHRNLPIAVQVIREVGADMVASTPGVAHDLQRLLAEAQLETQITQWHLVAPIGAREVIPPLPGTVALEYHLMPGISLGIAVPDAQVAGSFVTSDEYFFEVITDECFVTSLTPEAYPLIRVKVPGKATVVDLDRSILSIVNV